MPLPPPSYLFASNDPVLLSRAEAALLAAGAQVQVVLSAEAALAAMSARPLPDLVFLDAALPGMPVEDVLTALCAGDKGQRPPIVLIANSLTREWLDLLHEGALDDLIPRDTEPGYFQLRASSVLRSCSLACQLSALRESESRNAEHDRLTGVYNREGLLSLLFRETDRVQRMRSPLSLLLLDIDDFGHWNSRLGIEACDGMLCQMVNRIERMLRSYDLLGRTGKDEFLIALPGCPLVNAVTLAERLRLEAFSSPYRVGPESIRLSACFGIAQSHGRSPVVVLREAEQALAIAKQLGPESIQIFDGPIGPEHAPVTFFSSASGEEMLAW